MSDAGGFEGVWARLSRAGLVARDDQRPNGRWNPSDNRDVEDDAEDTLQNLAAQKHRKPRREEADDDHDQGKVPSGHSPLNNS